MTVSSSTRIRNNFLKAHPLHGPRECTSFWQQSLVKTLYEMVRLKAHQRPSNTVFLGTLVLWTPSVIPRYLNFHLGSLQTSRRKVDAYLKTHDVHQLLRHIELIIEEMEETCWCCTFLDPSHKSCLQARSGIQTHVRQANSL